MAQLQIPDPFGMYPAEEAQQKDNVINIPAQNNQQEVPKGPQPKYKKDDKMAKYASDLIGLASYLHELQIQAHLIHANYEGANFLGVHRFLRKQYEAHLDQFDKVGEFVRTLDYFLPMCHKGLISAGPKFKHVDSYEPDKMLLVYLNNLEELGMMSKKIEASSAKIKAIDVQNYAAELCAHAFKGAWMLKATMRNT